MILTIKSADHLQGEILLPSSKSYSIRAFIIAACGGTSRIINPSNCDDALVSIDAAKALGAKIKWLDEKTCQIHAYPADAQAVVFNVKESGTVLRFLLPLISLNEGTSRILGEGTLRGRPNTFLNAALRKMGVNIRGQGARESIPIVKLGGCLKGGTIRIDGSLSSQFISALLIACPRLKENSRLEIVGKTIVSETYIQMTLQILKKAGIVVKQKSPRSFHIPGGQKFSGLSNFIVPGDYGLAAFPLAAGALIPSQLVLKGNLKDDFVQSDGEILKFLKAMGVVFEKTDHQLKIKGPSILRGGNFSLKNSPDLVPIMAVLALFATGRTRLYDISHARAKESDRIGDLQKELQKVGAKITAKAGELTVYPQPQYKKNCLLDPHHDHRLAMAFCILGLKLGVRVKDIECTSKSYPDFVKDLKKIGLRFN